MPQSARRLRFQIDHVIALQHGGTTSPDNLALACGHCNRHKGPNVAGVDRTSGAIVRLFHPRQDRWEVHFAWNGAQLVGLTDIGRATIATLDMNAPDEIAVREELNRRSG